MVAATHAERARALILDGLAAGRYDEALDETIMRDVENGVDVDFERLDFDSLAWMEFCISIEANSRLELTPTIVSEMNSLAEIERWLVERMDA